MVKLFTGSFSFIYLKTTRENFGMIYLTRNKENFYYKRNVKEINLLKIKVIHLEGTSKVRRKRNLQGIK